MSYQSTILADTPLAYYPLNDAAHSTSAADFSGHGYAGTVSGGVTFGQTSLVPSDTADNAAAFDGSTGFIALPAGLTTALSGLSALSAEVWFSLPALPTDNPRLIANAHTDLDNNGFELAVNNSGAGGGFGAVGNGTNAGSSTWTNTLAAGTVYHYVMTYDGTNVRCYLNGTLVSTHALTGGGALSPSGYPVNIGRDPAYSGDYAKATLQHAALYAYALSAAQVTAHFTAGTTLPVVTSAPPLTLSLPMSLPRILLPPGPVALPGSALVTIGGVEVQVQHGSISIQNVVGQRSTGSFIVEDLGNAQRFKQGQPVYIYDDLGNVAFSGVVTDDARNRSPKAGDTLHTVSVADWHYLADKRLAAYSAQGKTAGQIATDLLNQFLAAEGVVAGTIEAGATVVSFIAGYAPVSAALDALVAKMGNGWYWQIDQLKRLQFQQQTSAPLAPFVANEDTMEWGTVTPTHGNPNYANSVTVLGGVAETSTQTETRQGDGKATAFTMSYPLASAPTITLNGGAQTVALKSAPSGTAQWYWAVGDAVIAQDTSGTKLVSTDTLSVTYVGQFPNIAISTNGSAVSSQQVREGVGSGVVETAVVDATTTSTTQAFQTAAGWLSKYAVDLDSIQFLTKEPGLAQGQLLTVDDPADDFNGAQMLIESCDLTDVGPNGNEIGALWYKVTAVSGPINQGWQAFFKQLAAQQNNIIDSIQVGQSQTVAILASFTATWAAWTASLTASVLVCPTFTMTFPKTFC